MREEDRTKKYGLLSRILEWFRLTAKALMKQLGAIVKPHEPFPKEAPH